MRESPGDRVARTMFYAVLAACVAYAVAAFVLVA
jgi:hypothetical protein